VAPDVVAGRGSEANGADRERQKKAPAQVIRYDPATCPPPACIVISQDGYYYSP
jgi:hypothetical protein